MPDWAIVLVAAFGGGLAGAVLQPVTAYVLETIRSKHEIRKRRERGLRRMLEAWLRHGRRIMVAQVRRSTGQRTDSSDLMDPSVPVWQGSRIADPDLRAKAEQYRQTMVELLTLLTSVEPDPLRGQQLIKELEDLQEQITVCMDELNWPEVDE